MLWVFGWLSMIQVSACLSPDLPQLGVNMGSNDMNDNFLDTVPSIQMLSIHPDNLRSIFNNKRETSVKKIEVENLHLIIIF